MARRSLDHGEEPVRVLLVAVASVQPGQQQVKGVAELVTVASPDLFCYNSCLMITVVREWRRTGRPSQLLDRLGDVPLLPLQLPLFALELVLVVAGCCVVHVDPSRGGGVCRVANSHTPAREIHGIVHTELLRVAYVTETFLTHPQSLDFTAFSKNLFYYLLGSQLWQAPYENSAAP